LSLLLGAIDVQTLKHFNSPSEAIDCLYNHIVTSIKHAASETLPLSKFNTHSKLYLTKEVKDASNGWPPEDHAMLQIVSLGHIKMLNLNLEMRKKSYFGLLNKV
jgi:hypothetical protein